MFVSFLIDFVELDIFENLRKRVNASGIFRLQQ